MTSTIDTQPIDSSTTNQETRLWSTGLPALVAATVANLALFLVVRASGVDFDVAYTADTTETTITSIQVIASTALPFLAGLGLTAVVAPRWRRGMFTVGALGAVLAVGSVLMPLGLHASTGARITLAAMHLVVGAAFVGGLALARRR